VSDQLYKVLVDGRGTYSRKPWPLPAGGEPGEWIAVDGGLRMCENGLHLTDWQGVWQHWMQWGATVYRAETGGDTIGTLDNGDRKIAARRARLLSVVPEADLPPWWVVAQQLVAELPTYDWLKPDGDPDPAWKLFDTQSAAESAARSAAESAARSAAESAARSAAESAAWSAARSAAESAAWSAARSAAWSAARSAAESAARSAAWSAALLASVSVTEDVIDPAHVTHAKARMDVWRKGYGLVTDVGGVLYVYERVAS
jgi:hypothetical protein